MFMDICTNPQSQQSAVSMGGDHIHGQLAINMAGECRVWQSWQHKVFTISEESMFWPCLFLQQVPNIVHKCRIQTIIMGAWLDVSIDELMQAELMQALRG